MSAITFLSQKAVLVFVAVTAYALFGAPSRVARAQDDPPAPPPAALVKMTEAHRALSSFDGVITVTGSDGKSEEITLAFRRPDRLRAVIVEKSKGKLVRGGPTMVYVDGKNVYVRRNKKWTRKPFKAGDPLFAAYSAALPPKWIVNKWISDLFYQPVAFKAKDAIPSEYTVKNDVKDGVAVTTFSTNYMNNQASIGYDVSYFIGNDDHLLREWTYATGVNSPLHSWDEGESAVRYTRVRANPVLPNSLFAPPREARRR